MTTLADVAQVAGVSKMTVSNVLAGREHKVSARTTQRVLAAVEQTGYVPNSAARALSASRSRLVAIVMRTPGLETNEQHGTRFTGAFTLRLQERGYCALLHAAADVDLTMRSLRGWAVDGVCFLNTMADETDALRERHDVPMLFPDNYSESPDVLTVRIDDYDGGRQAAEHLLGLGHRELCVVGPGAGRLSVAERRYRGFADAVEAAGVGAPAGVDGGGPDRAADIVDRVLALDPRPTAIFCPGDERAVRVMQELGRVGLRVPEDMSVIGFDGFDIGTLTTPQLTTIAQDVEAKARLSADRLLDTIEGVGERRPGAGHAAGDGAVAERDVPAGGSRADPLPVHLVVRGSTGRPAT
jgi:LacI family transcriptional regulator